MTKRILVLQYSQSGQLKEIMANFCSPLTADSERYELDIVNYNPAKAFPFPWTGDVFFDTMPETVLEIEQPLEPLHFKYEQYDMVILGYQPWYLSPSLPFSSLLQHTELQKRLKDTPVVTVIGSRNMWLNAQESVKKHIRNAGGMLVGNVPFIDKNNNLASAVSILHWMLTGKKTKKWGIFPLPGVSDKDIAGATAFGVALKKKFEQNELNQFQFEVLALNGVNISTSILFIEGRAKKLFLIWANLILRKANSGGNRKFWVNFFKYYLVIALFVVSPIVLTIYYIFVRPFTSKNIKAKKSYFASTALKD